MRTLISILCLVVVIAVVVSQTSGERPMDVRDKASHVITGKVDAVFFRKKVNWVDHIVRIKIETVHKGEGIEPKEFFYAFCSIRIARIPGTVGSSGHTAVPRTGQRIKSYVHRRNGLFEGNFPEWFDLVESDKRSDE